MVEETLNHRYEIQNIAWLNVQSLGGKVQHAGQGEKRKYHSTSQKSKPAPKDTNLWESDVRSLIVGYCHECNKNCEGVCGFWYSGYLPVTGW